MKRYLQKALILSALLPAWSMSAQAIPLVRDAVMNQEVAPANTATMDDYLLDLSRVAGVDVIADATRFPEASATKPYPSSPASIAGQTGKHKDKWTPTFLNTLGDFTAQHKLSILRTDERTFLFWSEPEPHELLAAQTVLSHAVEDARFAEAAAAARAAGVPEEKIIKGELSGDALQPVLWNYLRGRGWLGSVHERSGKVDIQARLSDLPPDLRALVLFDLQQLLGGRNRPVIGAPQVTQATDELRFGIEKEGTTTKLILLHQLPYNDGKFRWVSDPWTVLDDAAVGGAAFTPVSEEELAAAMPKTPPAPALADAKDAWFKAYSGISNAASDPALDADGSLGRTISLQAKRLPLSDLLAQMQQQGGVRLDLAQDAPTTEMVTARVEKMPLSKMMHLLSRIYGVKWSKGADGAYTMLGNDQGELHRKLLQIGDSARYRFRFMLLNSARDNQKAALGRVVVQQVGLAALQTPEGASISALPQSAQQQIRYLYKIFEQESRAKSLYTMGLVMTDQLAKNGLVLRFGNAVYESYHSPFLGLSTNGDSTKDFCFNVQSDDGTIVMPAFDTFRLHTPRPGEEDPPIYALHRDADQAQRLGLDEHLHYLPRGLFCDQAPLTQQADPGSGR